MKQYLPYNVLFIATIAITGLMIFYNLVLRETFAIIVAYNIPGAPQPQPTKIVLDVSSESQADEDEWIDYERADYDETPALTSVTFPIDINRATEEELRFIPQVGNVMAQRIVQYRDVIGEYTSLEQLKDIKGVGDPTFEKISAYLIIANEEQPLNELNSQSAIE